MKRNKIQVPVLSSDKRERAVEPFYREIDNAIARLTRLFVLTGSAGFLLAVVGSTLIRCDLARHGWSEWISIFSSLAMTSLMIFGCGIWAALQLGGAMNSLALASFEKSPGKETGLISRLLIPIGAGKSKMGLGIFALALAGVLMTALSLGIYANVALFDRLFTRLC